MEYQNNTKNPISALMEFAAITKSSVEFTETGVEVASMNARLVL